MKFVISSTELLSHLQVVSRVISSKNTLPILDNFLFKLSKNELEITASDLESTLITKVVLENASEEGSIAIPARILTDALKEFSEQPLTFEINLDSLAIVINSETGKFNIVGQNGSDFPQLPGLKDEQKISFKIAPDVLLAGISNTIFATAEDELRPVMNGIFIELSPDNLTFVASDAHKLVRYRRTDASAETDSSFIFPKKPASLLKNVLPGESNEVSVEFDEKNAYFILEKYKLVSRLIDGNYPSYSSVIPTDNPNKLTIDRVEFSNALRRVSVFSNQASNLVKLQISGNQISISAQDLDFSVSGHERFNCQYDGEEMEIGFKSIFLIEILSNISSENVVMELSDPTRAGLLFPAEKENDGEDVLMLLMPMMINT